MKRLRALAFALVVASMLVTASIGDDMLRAFCAGIGPDHPLYDYLGCRELLQGDPQG